jgi:cytosine/adenosine deaminase-related metal-dependent hydrolase
MSTIAVKSDLSAPRRRMVELMQELGFGRIETLLVRAGDPVLNPPPRVVREVKLGGQNAPRDERALADFALKAHVLELFDELDRLGDGVIDVLTIKHGLPFTMHVSQTTGAK